ncbi:MAG TPA: YceI family protein, partial [Flavobacteriaceae bacterium]|nr:YceI family protein [Flavobacteriaceae bacterium]
KTYLQGNLTLKETTKNIEFPVNVSLEGDKLILQSEKFNIDRTQWGINYQSKSIFTNLGDKFINDEIGLQVSVEANKV